MFTWIFWRASLERGVSTGAQFVIYQVIGVGLVAGSIVPGQVGDAINSFAWNWLSLLSAFVAGFILTILKCLATAKLTNGSPSANNTEVLAPIVPNDAPLDDPDPEPLADPNAVAVVGDDGDEDEPDEPNRGRRIDDWPH